MDLETDVAPSTSIWAEAPVKPLSRWEVDGSAPATIEYAH
jgi:hypothetical protein